MQARTLQVNGIVQGVGFRPHVARVARSCGCTGWVLNDTHGVRILVQHADEQALDDFERRLVEEAPACAHIHELSSSTTNYVELPDFSIKDSCQGTSKSTLISPDLATCALCSRELFDPDNRRYHYPFINCTNCGPRFTIIEDLPYDRPATSMRAFTMCKACAQEYADENDRRYHAQPDACFECGPRLWWMSNEEASKKDPAADNLFDKDGTLVLEIRHLSLEESDEIVRQACEQLANGSILAIKGLGGWHLACDARNVSAVEKLRQRKHRPTKPLAIMVKDINAARRIAKVRECEAELLESPARPIVLLERQDGCALAANVAESLHEIGIMLPSTPLQHLILEQLDAPLVMTSGNRSGEPIVARDADALEFLSPIADWLLGNNRPIVTRYDDSVARVDAYGDVQMIRRARGYAPSPLPIPSPDVIAQRPASILACGPEQKSTFALVKDDLAFVSQHLGDLEHVGAWRAWQDALARYERLFDIAPNVIACDLHPEYIASKWAREQARSLGLPLVEVQHHHAHIASVLGEHNHDGNVIGIALDGTGYGPDGTIWGGEILIASPRDYERFWHLPAFPLPGGSAAIFDPRRTAYAVLRSYGELGGEFFGQFALDNPQFVPFIESLEYRELVDQMIDKQINTPICSSAGRLFDAASALLGICTKPGYDGEAAVLLEASIGHGVEPSGQLTARSFHEGLINAIIDQTMRASKATGIRTVALSGGCMVNRFIYTQLREKLSDLTFEVLANRLLPPNDGCIAYGQAIVARARLEE